MTYWTRGDAEPEFAHDGCLPPDQFGVVMLDDFTTGRTDPATGFRIYDKVAHRLPCAALPWRWTRIYGTAAPCKYCRGPVERLKDGIWLPALIHVPVSGTGQAVLTSLHRSNRDQGTEVSLAYVIREAALPARTVAAAMSCLITKGLAIRIYLGVMIYAITPEGTSWLRDHGLAGQQLVPVRRKKRGRP